MGSEQKVCQNCGALFTIDAQDFAFYEKIKVPPPTFCPECRMVRRLVIRNERTLYKRKCDLCGRDIISMYSGNKPFSVYCPDCWNSDKWSSLNYGRDFNFSKTFFEQYLQLQNVVPRLSLFNLNTIHSEYSNYVLDDKNCYLSFRTGFSENCFFVYYCLNGKDSFDCYFIKKSELLYECFDARNCYNCQFLTDAENCLNCFYSYDLKNCSNCLFCSNLRHKQYYVENRSVTKEQFQKIYDEIIDGSRIKREEAKEKFDSLYKKQSLHRYNKIIKSFGASGENILNCKNVSEVYIANDSENVRYCEDVEATRDAMDVKGPMNAELIYEGSCIDFSSRIFFSSFCERNNYDIYYSSFCVKSHDCFGCISQKNGEYRILNKQYTKDEYEELVPKIIEHMNSMPYVDKKGRVYKYGEFFPPELSPFSYNETIAQEYFPLTKEQALSQGYSWKDREERNLQIDIKTEDLPDNIKDVNDSIINKIIECANAHPTSNIQHQTFSNCTTAFKIIPQELAFYRKMNLPLPRLCPNCRHYERLKQRNPLRLWHRKCMCGGEASGNVYQNTIPHFHKDKPCPNKFETTYGPDRSEIVYCEACYKQEVN